MKFVFRLFIPFLLLGIFSFHKYFFAFAEIEYKPTEKKVEATLIFTMHDLEQSLQKRNVISGEFERVKHDSIQLKKIENQLLQDFSINSFGKQINFNLLDFELTKNGLINLYFEAKNVELQQEMEIKFTNLMSDFPTQQNKVTYIQNGKKQTAVFLKHKATQKITL